MLLALGFDSRWVKIIMGCVTLVSYRLKINGSVYKQFHPQRGLPQGDPISPYLFLLCAEWLNISMDYYQFNGGVKGVSTGKGAPRIYIMFADVYAISCS